MQSEEEHIITLVKKDGTELTTTLLAWRHPTEQLRIKKLGFSPKKEEISPIVEKATTKPKKQE